MARFQFRKRFKIVKGVSLNISKRGLGLSAGPKGIKVSRSAQGRITGEYIDLTYANGPIRS